MFARSTNRNVLFRSLVEKATLTRNVQFVSENKEWLMLQEYFSIVFFLSICFCVLMYSQVNFALHCVIIADPGLCDSGNCTQRDCLTGILGADAPQLAL